MPPKKIIHINYLFIVICVLGVTSDHPDDDNIAYMPQVDQVDIGIEFPPYEDPPPPYSPPKPAFLPVGEAPPPYDDGDRQPITEPHCNGGINPSFSRQVLGTTQDCSTTSTSRSEEIEMQPRCGPMVLPSPGSDSNSWASDRSPLTLPRRRIHPSFAEGDSLTSESDTQEDGTFQGFGDPEDSGCQGMQSDTQSSVEPRSHSSTPTACDNDAGTPCLCNSELSNAHPKPYAAHTLHTLQTRCNGRGTYQHDPHMTASDYYSGSSTATNTPARERAIDMTRSLDVEPTLPTVNPVQNFIKRSRSIEIKRGSNSPRNSFYFENVCPRPSSYVDSDRINSILVKRVGEKLQSCEGDLNPSPSSCAQSPCVATGHRISTLNTHHNHSAPDEIESCDSDEITDLIVAPFHNSTCATANIDNRGGMCGKPGKRRSVPPSDLELPLPVCAASTLSPYNDQRVNRSFSPRNSQSVMNGKFRCPPDKQTDENVSQTLTGSHTLHSAPSNHQRKGLHVRSYTPDSLDGMSDTLESNVPAPYEAMYSPATSLTSRGSLFSVCSETGESKRPRFGVLVAIPNDAQYPLPNQTLHMETSLVPETCTADHF